MKHIIIALLIPTLMLGGCATMSAAEKQQTKTLVIAKCPVLKNYSKEKLQRAAAELKGLPDDSELAALLTDYSKLRDACRAITKQLKK
jgi:hypothetical protein